MRSKNDASKGMTRAIGLGLITVWPSAIAAQEMKPAIEETFTGGEARSARSPSPH